MKLQYICDDIFGLILDYLDLKNINDFLDSSLELEYYKNNFYCIILDEYDSKKYYLDEIYHEEIDKELKEKLVKKLSLTFHNFDDIKDVRALCNIHRLIIIECNNIKDVSALCNVHTLTLESCKNISDVNPLSNVHNLTLSWCPNITDVNALCNVHTLLIGCCKNITDVSALGNIHTLKILGCRIFYF